MGGRGHLGVEEGEACCRGNENQGEVLFSGGRERGREKSDARWPLLFFLPLLLVERKERKNSSTPFSPQAPFDPSPLAVGPVFRAPDGSSTSSTPLREEQTRRASARPWRSSRRNQHLLFFRRGESSAISKDAHEELPLDFSNSNPTPLSTLVLTERGGCGDVSRVRLRDDGVGHGVAWWMPGGKKVEREVSTKSDPPTKCD